MSIGRVPGVTGIQPSIVDAKGDLIVATAADSIDRLAVGANNTVLTADSATATGLKWAALPASGKVLQVVYGSYSTEVVVASTTFTDTGLTATITPSAATSKVLVLVAQLTYQTRNNAQGAGAGVRLLRGTTSIFDPANGKYQHNFIRAVGSTTVESYTEASIHYLDSPNTTSSITYKTQGACFNAADSGNASFQVNGSTSTIILLEIGA